MDLSPDARGLLNGPQITRLMRRHGWTIRRMAASMGLTMTRVRHVRVHGTTRHYDSRDWLQAITGEDPGDLNPAAGRWLARIDYAAECAAAPF